MPCRRTPVIQLERCGECEYDRLSDNDAAPAVFQRLCESALILAAPRQRSFARSVESGRLPNGSAVHGRDGTMGGPSGSWSQTGCLGKARVISNWSRSSKLTAR